MNTPKVSGPPPIGDIDTTCAIVGGITAARPIASHCPKNRQSRHDSNNKTLPKAAFMEHAGNEWRIALPTPARRFGRP
jgi:hypothetical protein